MGNQLYTLKVGDAMEPVHKMQTFLRNSYPSNTAYFFENSQGTISVVSLPNDYEYIGEFENKIGEYVIVMDFRSDNADPQFKEKVGKCCPGDIETRDICLGAKDSVKKISKNVGVLFGKLASYAKKPAGYAGGAISERANKFKDSSISEETKGKWKGVVKKASSINEVLSSYCTPLVTKFDQLSSQIGDSFKNSENRYISTIREYSFAIRDSLNEGESEGVRQDDPLAEERNEEASTADLKE